MQIQWYPGHMAKTKRMMQTHIALVDIVIELLDARIPYSSKNPDISQLAKGKQRIVVLNKADLAAPDITADWEKQYTQDGTAVIRMDSRQKAGALKLVDTARTLMRDKTERQKQRGRMTTPIRAMVVGIPNVGKSTFVNQLAGRAGAATGDRPGVTRGRQWIKVGTDFDLLDTPGVLWPKFEDASVGLRLAITGAVSDDILDRITLCEGLLSLLADINPSSFVDRYHLSVYENEKPRTLLEMIGAARGFKMKGGVIDIERAAIVVLDEFRAGKLGRISLERPFVTVEPPAPVSPTPPQS